MKKSVAKGRFDLYTSQASQDSHLYIVVYIQSWQPINSFGITYTLTGQKKTSIIFPGQWWYMCKLLLLLLDCLPKVFFAIFHISLLCAWALQAVLITGSMMNLNANSNAISLKSTRKTRFSAWRRRDLVAQDDWWWVNTVLEEQCGRECSWQDLD